jgi:zinc/manganese transport system substrate-binding protein
MKDNKHVLMILAVLITVLGMFATVPAYATINVVAATPDLADIAKQVGGSKVAVTSIARGNQDLHSIEPRPSDVMRVKRADVVVRVGMDLDMWMDALLNAAANNSVSHGGRGYVDASVGIQKLEVPREQVSGASGDIHVFGNPHYWLDPLNGVVISQNILDGLKRVSPADAAYFEKNRNTFVTNLRAAMRRWQDKLGPYRGRKIVIYHDAWPYFNHRFGLVVLGCIEPKPGIPPTASHVASLIDRIKAEKQPVVIADAAFYPDKAAKTIAAKTGAEFFVIPSSVGGVKGADNYIALFDCIVDNLARGFAGR